MTQKAVGGPPRSRQFKFPMAIITVGMMMLLFFFAVLVAAPHGAAPSLLVQLQNVYSAVFMVNLFIWVYGATVFFWTVGKIDYIHAFMFDPTTALGYKQVWTFATVLIFVPFVCTLYNVAFDYHGGIFPSSIAPFITFLFYAAVLTLPCSLLYRESRLYFFKILTQCCLPYFFGVDLIHNFVADALTSACLLLWRIEYTLCFFLTGDWLSPEAPQAQSCGAETPHRHIMLAAMYTFPFFVRFMQCIVRVWQERRKRGWKKWSHVVNAGKYLSCVWLVIASTLNTDLQKDPFAWGSWRFNWFIAILIKTTYCFVWDIYCDWGLGDKKHGFLRKELMFSRKWVYYQAIATNLLGRISWSVAISPRQCPFDLQVSLALIEIFRRGQWAVFRIEYEIISRMNAELEQSEDRDPKLLSPISLLSEEEKQFSEF